MHTYKMWVALVLSTCVFQLHVPGSNLQNSFFLISFNQNDRYVLNLNMYNIFPDLYH